METKPRSIKPGKTTAKGRHVTVNPIAAVKDDCAHGGLNGVEGQSAGKVPQKQARIGRAARFCLKGQRLVDGNVPFDEHHGYRHFLVFRICSRTY
jgi:hypothetical protein